MAWRTTSVEDEKKLLINSYLDGHFSLALICRELGISRKTAYKWIQRFENQGYEGLNDRSRARQSQVKTDSELEGAVLKIKKEREGWGPKKILGHLETHHSEKKWPSASTVGNILLRNGFQKTREIKKRLPKREEILSHCTKPNDLWSIDFKGWFKTKDGVKCDPLTISDGHTRFLLYCSKLPLGTAEYVWRALEKVFYEYGLPTYLRHDNGPPFATCGVGRLSPLSIKLIKAGVIPEWIDPGKPYQNGRHERMHRTLKAEAVFPMKLTLQEQEIKFGEFLHYFNFIRPHESLGQKTPGSIYSASPRQWDGILKSPEYDTGWQTVRVSKGGQITWRGDGVFISKTLESEYLGLKENEEGDWELYYGPVKLGIITREGKLDYSMRQLRIKRAYKERVY